MRTDVKLGVVISMVVVFVAGGYFIFRGGGEKPVDLAQKAANPASTPVTDDSKGHAARPADANANRRNQPLPNRGNHQPATNPAVPQNTPTNPASTPAVAQNDRGLAGGAPAQVAQDNANRTGNASTNPVQPVANPPAPAPTQGNPSPNTLAEHTNPAIPQTIQNPNNQQAPSSAMEALAAMRRAAAENRPTTTPASAAVDIHRAQPGDTLASIAQSYYGSAKYVPVLRQANPDVSDPSSLRVGSAIRIPPLPAGAERMADATPAKSSPAVNPASATAPGKAPAGASRTYVVRPGDSFYKIAEQQLGKASRWKELLALNKTLVDGDPTRLRVGQKVLLPES